MLSIVIPTRNREKELSNLLNALNRTDTVIDEIIIVDSSDKISNKLNVNSNHKIVYHHTPIKSASIQRNIGISLVNPKCEFLFFLDDDVLPSVDYFNELIYTLRSNSAIGVSGLAINSKKLNKRNTNLLIKMYKYLFLLDSKTKGVILSSGVNIPADIRASRNKIIRTQWLIGCALWDFQKINNLRFDNRLFGQSLGEDVIFSLKASRKGTLFVNLGIVLEHTESDKERPNQFDFFRMWVKNRYLIVSNMTLKKHHIAFHWCNLGKSIILFTLMLKNPIKSISGLAGIIFGYLDLIRSKNAN